MPFVSAGNTSGDTTVLSNEAVCRSFVNHTVQVSSSPYFTDEYKTANIKLTSGRLLEKVKMKTDLVGLQVLFISSNGIEINFDPGMVKQITYSDTTANAIVFYKFQTGFPVIDRQDRNNFYLVLADGNCTFVKSIFKKAIGVKKIVLSEVADEYETFEEYYLFINGGIKKLKKGREFILAELSDKQVEVNQFILTNQTNFKNLNLTEKKLVYQISDFFC
jgi:hypothetical protein